MAKYEVFTRREPIEETQPPHLEISRRVRRAFLRAKDYTQNLSDDGQETPDEYAEDQVKYALTDIANDAGQRISEGLRRAIQKDFLKRDSFPQQSDTPYTPHRRSTTAMVDLRNPEQPAQTKTNPNDSSFGRRAFQIQETRQIEKAIKDAKKAAQNASKAAQNSKAAAITANRAAKAAEKAAKATAKAVKAIIAELKALITTLAASGGSVAIVIVIICLVGLLAVSVFGIFFAGEDTGTGMTLQTAVQKINRDFTTKIDAVIAGTPHDEVNQSGSRAPWRDILAVYAVMTTSDPEHPQEVVSMTEEKLGILTELFWNMNEVGSQTETRMATETTETTTSSGNVVITAQEVFVTTLIIQITGKTAEEMVEELAFNNNQKEQLAELLSEKYASLWNTAFTGIGSNDLVSVALSQVGNVGGEPYWSYNGFSFRVAWCACFVSWCADQCGYIQDGTLPVFSACQTGIEWFKQQGRWQDGSYIPNPGDIIFFDWKDPKTGQQNGISDHVGIVEKVENGYVYTIEGNCSDTVATNCYPVGNYAIMGYGSIFL